MEVKSSIKTDHRIMRTGVMEMDNHSENFTQQNNIGQNETNTTIAMNNSCQKSPGLKNCETYRLELIFGPMWSGKSSELMRRLRRYKIFRKVIAVNTKKDMRYGDQGIITHDTQTMHSIRVNSLEELIENQEYRDADVIGIDEGNFFPEIATFIVKQLETTNKTFIIAGLDSDKDKKFFGTLHELIPHAEKKDFMRALCKRCGDGTEASFSIDLVVFEGQEKAGGSEIYQAVCRHHYNQIRHEQSQKVLNRSGPK